MIRAEDLLALLGKSIDEVMASHVLREIGECSVRELIEDQVYLSLPASGLDLCAEADQQVTTVHFYASGHDTHRPYPGTLPLSLTFTETKAETRQRLGRPSMACGPIDDPILGRRNAWDRYDGQNFCVHISFAENLDAIEMVTVMLLEHAP